MAKVFVAASHKGGTGRSVSMANVAYRLAASLGRSVCLVDLDFASPTMGTVLGLSGVEAGRSKTASSFDNPRSVTDIIIAHKERREAWNYVDRALRDTDVWSQGVLAELPRPSGAGDFKLLPAAAKQGDPFTVEDLIIPLKETVKALRLANMDIIILDVRSGLSEPLRAMLAEEMADMVSAYIFHFRWTPQQLNGLSDVLSASLVQACPRTKIRFLKTAKLKPENYGQSGLSEWIKKQDTDLQTKFDDVLKAAGLDADGTLLGEVPMEPLLQWQETIVTRRRVQQGVAQEATLESFESIARKLDAIPEIG